MQLETANTGPRDRIRDGSLRAIVRSGASASMADIARACGVSKALLHYHYADRAHLLADVVDRLATRVVSRERAAIGAAAAGTALDTLWAWTSGELQRGEIRVLLELALQPDSTIRDAAARAATTRRTSGTATTTHLFAELGLTPRLPAPLLGDAFVAFLDGLALDAGSGRDARVSFDVFWLAMLSLGE